jgi:hypothetical protein
LRNVARALCKIDDAVALQRAKKDDQLRPFRRREAKRANRRIEIRVRTAPAVVELDDLFEGVDTSIVHVRPGEGDVAQARRLEAAAIFR